MREQAGLQNNQISRLLAEGWEIQEYKMNRLQINIRGLLYAMPFLLFAGGLYHMFLSERAVLLDNFFLHLAAILTICVPLHESLHGIGWMMAGHAERNSIRFTFRQGMPHCFCRSLLTSRQYLAGLMMPFLVQGSISLTFLMIYPGTLSLLTAFVNIFLAGGDLAFAFAILRSGAALVANIPEQAGFVAAVRRQYTSAK